MQYRLRTLIAASTLVAVFCAIFFATPLSIELPILAFIVLVSPSFWIVGAYYARREWRPFFLGVICGGWLPHAFLGYVGWMFIMSPSGMSVWDSLAVIADNNDNVESRVVFACCFLFPGFAGLIGGICGLCADRWFGRELIPATQPTTSALNQPPVVIEGRTDRLRPGNLANETATSS